MRRSKNVISDREHPRGDLARGAECLNCFFVRVRSLIASSLLAASLASAAIAETESPWPSLGSGAHWEAELFRAGIARDFAGSNQLAMLYRFRDSLSAGQRATVRELLLQAQEPAARFFILKALVAGESWPDVVQYATEMRGLTAEEIIRRSTARGDREFTQQWEYSCAPAVVQVMIAEADPLFAWELNKEAIIPDAAPLEAPTPRAEQQRLWLEQYGGVATPRGDRSGRGISLVKVLNEKLGQVLGAAYSCHEAADFATAISQIAGILRSGYDVPLCLSWAPPESATGTDNHFVVALAVRDDGTSAEFQIYDPWTGKTAWVSGEAMRRNTLSPIFERYQRLTHFYEGTPVR